MKLGMNLASSLRGQVELLLFGEADWRHDGGVFGDTPMETDALLAAIHNYRGDDTLLDAGLDGGQADAAAEPDVAGAGATDAAAGLDLSVLDSFMQGDHADFFWRGFEPGYREDWQGWSRGTIFDPFADPSSSSFSASITGWKEVAVDPAGTIEPDQFVHLIGPSGGADLFIV